MAYNKMEMKSPAIKIGHHPDYVLMGLVFLLTTFGLVMLASASSELGKIKFNDSYYYIKHQMLYGLSVGILGFFVAAKIHYQFYRRIAVVLLLISLASLVLVFTKFGVTAHSASRWVQLGPITFQPAEFLKITYILYLAAWLSNPKANRQKGFYEGLLPFLLISGTVAGLLLFQPATSIVVILMTSGATVYFLSGAKLRYIAGVGFLGILTLAFIIYATPYRLQRITGFLEGEVDTQGSNYHRTQAMIAIGSGGIWGTGYGQSTSKVNYLPAPIDDSIFAVIAQELGFIGAGTVIILFAFLTLRLFWLAHRLRDKYGKLILAGFGTIIAFQSLINIAAISGSAPVTGIPLPFISYGGTALAVFLVMGGIATNVSKYT
jgi:cell division protein FtsW